MYVVTSNQNIDLKAKGVKRILQNVSNLLSTIKGEIPLGRDIGLPSELIDKRLEELRAVYTKEILELIKEKEPRAKISNIDFESDETGKITPKVEVTVIE